MGQTRHAGAFCCACRREGTMPQVKMQGVALLPPARYRRVVQQTQQPPRLLIRAHSVQTTRSGKHSLPHSTRCLSTTQTHSATAGHEQSSDAAHPRIQQQLLLLLPTATCTGLDLFANFSATTLASMSPAWGSSTRSRTPVPVSAHGWVRVTPPARSGMQPGCSSAQQPPGGK